MAMMRSPATLCRLLFLASAITRPILGNGDRCTFTPRNTEIELSSDVVEYTMNALELSALSYSKGLNADEGKYGYDSFQVWRNFNNADLALLATQDGVCYAAFRGTIEWNILDAIQVYERTTKQVGDCKVRTGWYNAYYSGYYKEFRQAVDDCMQATPGSQLVVTGQSQGGSNAVVAYMDLKEYNPIAITFGALRTIVGDCDSYDFSRHYRYTNSYDGLYDAWPNRFSKIAKHFGQAIQLDASAAAPGVYLGLNDDRANQRVSYSIHKPWKYLDSLRNMKDTGCSPIQLSGWEDGHWCSFNDECDSGACVNQVCVPWEDGHQCTDDNTCDSGSCKNQICTGSLQTGDLCRNYYDCESQQCFRNWLSFRKTCQ